MLSHLYHYSVIDSASTVFPCVRCQAPPLILTGKLATLVLSKRQCHQLKIVISRPGSLVMPLPPCKDLKLSFLICKGHLSYLSLHLTPQKGDMSNYLAQLPELGLGLPFPQLPLWPWTSHLWPHSSHLRSVSEIGINDLQGTFSCKISWFYWR